MSKKECYVHRINGMPDHVRLLIDAPCTLAPSQLVGELKRQSSLVINSDKVVESWPGWSEEKIHHLKHSFLEEYRNMLVAQGVPADDPSMVAIMTSLRKEDR